MQLRFKKPEKIPVIVVSSSYEEDYTVLSIEDNGIGMDLEKYGDKLFGSYQTLGDHRENIGMGLYLTKYQIELMDGKIEVESELNEGSTFKIYFKNTLN